MADWRAMSIRDGPGLPLPSMPQAMDPEMSMTVVSLASRRTAASVFSASVSEFASSRLALLAWLPSTPRLAVRSKPGPPAASRKPAERSACCEPMLSGRPTIARGL